ncbi:MAG TPA: hypothetical protein PLX88_08335 [Syntrophorhabdaceae bacterium]|jgi:hypothetical protein|nr:hypothetical protein [Syntrophorhabdaceae bacterium]MDI9560709.1 hypothetical protein [Pseudomonadota bacterium]MBV6505504.1 hypothetical protein [Syntrophorhabdaceae bacterium]HNQ63922.1 hypothetical protein [Syntrophorhabdaceae bacterium]HNZ59337.1 hypothetical protein [Syntrophorhabdaceae bacterium]
MAFEYTIKIFSMEDLKRENIVVDAEKNIVYACRPEGECEIHDVGMEQLENLSQIFNKMGSEGWELVQLFFRPLGIVSFWKRHSPSA